MDNTKEKTHIRVFTAFSGYDSQCLALDRIAEKHPEFSYETVGWSEIDRYAIIARNTLYPDQSNLNYGDISKIDWNSVPDFDLFTYSSPCTNFSSLGNKKGAEKNSGTASSLLWYCENAIKTKKPSFLLMENVQDIKKKKFSKTIHQWMLLLESLGYENHAFILDSLNFGLPQQRKRMFMVSQLHKLSNFQPPSKQTHNHTHISQILDSNPKNFGKTPKKTLNQHLNTICPEPLVIPRTHGYIKPTPRTFSPALTTSCQSDYFILFPDKSSRSFTPSEALKLMGLNQATADKLTLNHNIPPSQIFKLAGNSIALPVITAILENLLFPNTNLQQNLLF